MSLSMPSSKPFEYFISDKRNLIPCNSGLITVDIVRFGVMDTTKEFEYSNDLTYLIAKRKSDEFIKHCQSQQYLDLF